MTLCIVCHVQARDALAAQLAAEAEAASAKQESLTGKVASLKEQRGELRTKLAALQEELADARGQLQLESYAKSLVEGKEAAHQGELERLETELKERCGELEALRKQLEV
jgi:hypothetical protein